MSLFIQETSKKKPTSVTITPKNIVEILSKAKKALDDMPASTGSRLLHIATNYGIVQVDVDENKFYGHRLGVEEAKRMLNGAFDNP